MDETEIGSTAPHDHNMTQPSVPKLRGGINGWTGKGKTWRVVNNVIKIKNTDASSSRAPSSEQRKLTVDDEGNFSVHIQLEDKHETYQLWMNKIGPYLADWVLGKARYGASHATLSHLASGTRS
jgi:hypothetical protein